MNQKYSSFVSLNKNFKPVYSLDTDDDELWKRFIFTSDFEKLVSSLSPIFQDDSNKKKSYILTGKYGVGKSHATSVLSHLLWDDFGKIKGKLEETKKEMREIGYSLYYFREKSKMLPVILTQKSSINSNTAKDFELELQLALESSLKKYGFYEYIKEKTDFERYSNWLNELISDSSKKVWIEYINKLLPEMSYFSGVSELLDALDRRDKEALEVLSALFHSLKLSIPQHLDVKEYYSHVLNELKQIDSSISGIIIYWDEFTTVFNACGRYNDTTLIGAIQLWAELASNNIYLFLVSHRSPEQFRGIYKDLDQDLARINDRFYISHLKLDKITTSHLIASSLKISDEEQWKNFLKANSFDIDLNYERHRIKNKFGNIFDDLGPRNERYIKRTIPFHPYSLYIASVLTDIVGSSERSIFQLIYGEEEEEYDWGKRIGFSKFLESEPSKSFVSWYTVDMVFDYFFFSFSDIENEYSNNPTVKKAINFFRQNYHFIKALGDEHLKISKIIVIMESLHAIRDENNLIPSEENLKRALDFTQFSNLRLILSDLVEKNLIISQEDRSGAILYKTSFSGTNERDIAGKVEKIGKKITFEKFLEQNEDSIINSIVEKSNLNNVCRIRNGYSKFILISADSVKDKENILENIGNSNNLEIVIIIPKNSSEIPNVRSHLLSISNTNKNTIFILYDGTYEKYIERWVKATATIIVADENKDTTMMEEANNWLEKVIKDFNSELNKKFIIFNGNFEMKVEGLDREVKRCCEDIFNKGLDYNDYGAFWKQPKNFSKSLLELYGLPNARELLNEKKHDERRMLDILSSKMKDLYINENLELRDEEFVRRSVFFEIVVKIREYMKSKIGNKFTVREMIQELELERPPYGLCGWIESIIVTYALAPFYSESRLEVINGNSTTSKECASIVTAVNESIKKPEANIYLRYGSQEENKLVSNLKRIFKLEELNKTLKEISFSIREKINSQGVPLWSLPYIYNSNQNNLISKFVENIDHLLQEISIDGNDYQKFLAELNRLIIDLEYEYGPNFLNDIFNEKSMKEGFKSFVESHNSRIFLQYPDFENLIIEIKSLINMDPWLWDPVKVIETLNKLTIDKPPSQPINLKSVFDGGKVSLTWNPPEKGENLPSSYLIYRFDETNSMKLLSEVPGTTVTFKDKSTTPFRRYKYTVTAKNSVGESPQSNIEEIFILPLPPQIKLNTEGEENLIRLSWHLPDKKYKVSNFKIYRGVSTSDLTTMISILDGSTNFYEDYSLEINKKYYYTITAANDSGEGKRGNSASATLKQKIKIPPKIQGLKVNLTNEGVKLSWQKNEEKESKSGFEYLLFRDSCERNGELISIQSGNEYLDKSIQEGKIYNYWVVGKNCAGEGKPTEKTKVNIPKKPPEIKFEINTDSEKVILKWEPLDESYRIVKYNIYRGETQINLKLLDSQNHPLNIYEDTFVNNGETYYYSVTGINSLNIEGKRGKIESYGIPKPFTTVNINQWKEDSKIIAKSNIHEFFSIIKDVITETYDLEKVPIEYSRLIEVITRSSKEEIVERGL